MNRIGKVVTRLVFWLLKTVVEAAVKTLAGVAITAALAYSAFTAADAAGVTDNVAHQVLDVPENVVAILDKLDDALTKYLEEP